MTRPDILRVGVTGGIASGKSTVSRRLARCGACVVDMDALAHEVIDPGGPAHDAVVERFGRDILREDGTVDRPRLGAQVFSDEAARRDLEAIVHPAVRDEAERRIQAAAASAEGPTIAVIDAALLVETGRWRELDVLIVVACRPVTQLRRIVERDGLTREEAQRRLDAQLPLERKVEVADMVIDSEQPLEQMLARVDRVYELLTMQLRAR